MKSLTVSIVSPSICHKVMGPELMGMSGSVSYGVTAPFSWVLACMHKVLFVPSKSLFPQSCVSSDGSMVEIMATSSKWAYAISRSTEPRAPALQRLTADHTSIGGTQTQSCLSLCGISGSWCAQVLFQPSEHLWQVWGLILNVILPPLTLLLGLLLFPWTWGISSKSLQHWAAHTPVTTFLLGLLFLSIWCISS